MRGRVFSFLFTMGCLFGLGTASDASVVTYMDDPTLVRLSSVVAHANVASVSVVTSPDRAAIYTDVRLSVIQMFRGPSSTTELTVRLLGGRDGDRESRIFGMPRFLVGEEVVIFARPTKSGWLTVTGLFQGKISVERTAGGDAFAVRSNEAADASVVVVPRGNLEPARVPLSSWLSELRQLVHQYPSIESPWEAQADELLPSTSADATPQPPSFTLLQVPLRRFEPDVGNPVVYFYNPTGAPAVPGGARAAFENALDAWSTVPGAAIVPQDGGDTGAQCYLTFDGVTGVSHGDPCGEVPAFDTSTCSGVLAIGGLSEITTLELKWINGQLFFRGSQGDVVFNDGADCFWAGPGNYEEVMTHEIGHTMGLGHSCGDTTSPTCATDPLLNEAQMRAFAHGDARGASPRRDDIKGLRFIYPPSAFAELHTQDTNLTTGDTLRFTLDLNGTAPADLWFFVYSPALGPRGGLAVPGLPLAYAVDIDVVQYTFNGSELPGPYAALVILTAPGQLPKDPSAILSRTWVVVNFAP